MRAAGMQVARALVMLLAAMAAPSIAAPRDTGAFATFRSLDLRPQTSGGLRRQLYRNPIIPGFHPDPSIVRVGGDYYLVNSSFAFFPGLPIFHSTDLVHWTHIGNAADKPEYFDFRGQGVARGLFAPTLRYRAGVFYIINTAVDRGGNFIITARNPAGPWSKPVYLAGLDGIDPDLFFNDDGRVWVANNGPPAGAPRYPGHRAIWLQELDLATMKLIGPRTVIVDGGVHPADQPIWTEGPHIFKAAGYYYLITAEGGTAGQHSETVYRARTVTGPYSPGPINPILTQRDLDADRPHPVYATGHADFVQTPQGDWWAVFLGTRPYRANLSNMGRETFLLPVRWQGGWPIILPAHTPVPRVAAAPRGMPVRPAHGDAAPRSGDWLTLRGPITPAVASGQHSVILRAQPVALSAMAVPSFLATQQRAARETIVADLDYAPTQIGDRAGLASFADEAHFFTFGLTQTALGRALEVTRRAQANDPEDGAVIAHVMMPRATTRVRLRLRMADPDYGFDYAIGSGPWRTLLAHADSSVLASEPTNQFTGVVVGPFALRARPSAPH